MRVPREICIVSGASSVFPDFEIESVGWRGEVGKPKICVPHSGQNTLVIDGEDMYVLIRLVSFKWYSWFRKSLADNSMLAISSFALLSSSGSPEDVVGGGFDGEERVNVTDSLGVTSQAWRREPVTWRQVEQWSKRLSRKLGEFGGSEIV